MPSRALIGAAVIGVAVLATVPPTFDGRLLAGFAAPRQNVTERRLGQAQHRLGGRIIIVAEYGRGSSLSRVGDVAWAPNGDVVITDVVGSGRFPDARVLRFDSVTSPLGSLGRFGQGPGEYGSATSVAVLSGGSVAVYDRSGGRINVYAASGSFATAWSLGGLSVAASETALQSSAAGGVFVRVYAQVDGRTREAFVRFDSSGRVRDTTWVPANAIVEPVRIQGARGEAWQPYGPASFVAIGRSGVLVSGTSDRFVMTIHPTGDMAGRSQAPTRIVGTTDPVPLTASERRSLLDGLENRIGRVRNGLAAIPTVRPVFESLLIADDDVIWVARNVRMDSRIVPVFDLITTGGEYVGRVGVGANLVPMAVRGDSGVAVMTDSDGVPSVVKFRISWLE